MSEGRDISELNGVRHPDWFARWDFVIVRAFNERGRMDATLDANLTASKGRTLRGVYGWPIAGDDNYTLGRALGLVAADVELGGCADFELGGRARLPSPRELDDYLAGITSTGVVAWWYSNRSDYHSLGSPPDAPWWFANPSGNPEPRHPVMVQYGIVDGVDADRSSTADLATLQGTPIPPDPGDVDMLVVIFGQSRSGVQVAYLMQGSSAIATWGPPATHYGCPDKALEYVNAHPGTPLVLATPDDLARAVAH